MFRRAMMVACVAGSALADVREVPGSMEFSGRLIARPVPMEALEAQGITRQLAAARMDQARQVLASYETISEEPRVGYSVIQLRDGEGENEAIDRLMATGLFDYVEPDWILYPVDCPDDPRLNNQWHHDADRMDSCDGWDLHTGEPTVTVGICDTGVQTSHPDLQLHRKEAYNAVNRLWESEGGSIEPVHPHGTQCTGCAAANGDNGIGVAGVGWNLSHRMIRVSNDAGGGASLSNLMHGALTSIGAGDRVASVSYSGVNSSTVRATATTIKGMNGLLVFAAGNDGANLNWGHRDDDDVIVVGATDSNDNLAGFSARGNSVDVTAPGVSVHTTTTGSAYSSVSGTSFACPLTAGLCGLIWSSDPSLTPDEVELALKLACDDLGAPGQDTTFGYGRINVRQGLLYAGGLPVEFEYASSLPDTINPNGGTTLDVTITTNDVDIFGMPVLNYDSGQGLQDTTLEHLGGDDYRITFPAVECGSTVQYHVTVFTTGGDSFSSPFSAPSEQFSTLAVTGVNTIVAENFESQNGWTTENEDISDGQWTRGVPAGGGTRGDPENDADGSGSCWLTDNVEGNSDVDGGPTRLVSPAFDLTSTPDAFVTYQAWFTNDDGDGDRLTVDVSDDNGATWVTAQSFADGAGWRTGSFAVTDHVDATSTVRVRFSATDNPNDSVTEAAIDDFRIVEYECGGCGAADVNGDTTLDIFDVLDFLDLLGQGDTGADWNADTVIDIFDVTAFLADFEAGC